MVNSKEISEKIQFPYKETDDIEVTYQLAIDYYCALHLAGHKIQLEWNGGGDSGSVWLNIDKQQVDVDHWRDNLGLYDRIHAFIINEMYDCLDYGSWAGEFSASGTAEFVIEDEFIGFQGTDFYSEDDFHSVPMNFKIHIPKHLIPANAGRLVVSMSGGYDNSEVDVTMRFYEAGKYDGVPISKESEERLFVLENDLQSRADELMEANGGDHTYMDHYLEITPGEDLDTEIEEFDFYTVKENPREIYINLFDMMQQQEKYS